MSMNGAALAAALEASQAKAIAALGKAYVRRDEEPDPDLFRQLMKGMGLDDDFAITFLFHAWDVLREQRWSEDQWRLADEDARYAQGGGRDDGPA
jgi:hypothetical protein